MLLTYLGHSAFEIELNGKKILIDPFLVKCQNYNPAGVTDIFVTHGHSDHLGGAIEISRNTNATITAIFELANYCASKGARANGINLGAWIDYPWGRVAAVPAFHSSSTPDGKYAGCPCGFVFKIGGRVLYHAGDTCLNSEMKMIGEFYKPDLAMLPIGGTYTMDIEAVQKASEWLEADAIVPMHYNTFEAISVDLTEFETVIRELGKVPLVMKVGQTISV